MAVLGTLKRLLSFKPQCQRVAHYYMKPKKRRGPSGQALLALAGVSTALLGTGVYFLGQPEEDIAGLESKELDKYANEFVVKAYLYRAWDNLKEIRRQYTDPSSNKLLPDYLPPPYQQPYTLVIEMNDLLLHSTYDRLSGWNYQKRPGVDALLLQLVHFYEIVVFTSETAITGHSLLTALDPNQCIQYRLYRDSTNYTKGVHVKDLTHLNRPLNRVIIVDTDKSSVSHQENSIILDEWKGDIDDKILWDLIPFLQTIAVNGVDDVRPVLDFYKGQRGEDKILETFRLNQAQLRAEEQRQRKEIERLSKQGARQGMGGAISTFSLSWKHQAQMPANSPHLPPLSEDPPTHPTSTPTQTPQSWNEWIANWIGWR